jgi:hypothetical protein
VRWSALVGPEEHCRLDSVSTSAHVVGRHAVCTPGAFPRCKAHTLGMSRSAVMTAAIVALGIVTACTGHQRQPAPTATTPAPSATPTTQQRGEIHGQLVTAAGRQTTPPRPVPGTITIAGPERRTITIRADGHYSAVLAPGTYQVTGRSPSFARGHGFCGTYPLHTDHDHAR